MERSASCLACSGSWSWEPSVVWSGAGEAHLEPTLQLLVHLPLLLGLSLWTQSVTLRLVLSPPAKPESTWSPDAQEMWL